MEVCVFRQLTLKFVLFRGNGNWKSLCLVLPQVSFWYPLTSSTELTPYVNSRGTHPGVSDKNLPKPSEVKELFSPTRMDAKQGPLSEMSWRIWAGQFYLCFSNYKVQTGNGNSSIAFPVMLLWFQRSGKLAALEFISEKLQHRNVWASSTSFLVPVIINTEMDFKQKTLFSLLSTSYL